MINCCVMQVLPGGVEHPTEALHALDLNAATVMASAGLMEATVVWKTGASRASVVAYVSLNPLHHAAMMAACTTSLCGTASNA
jgi:hypothetical protein